MTAKSPVGSTAKEAARRRAEASAAYRREHARLAPFREIAWLLIKYRMDKGLTQQELANMVGTSHSQISRIESGRQKTSFETLVRIAHALDLKLLVGFEHQSKGETERELVTI